MKIGIDARFYGLKHAGLGRYIQNLIIELEKIDHQNHYFIFLQKDNFDEFKPQNHNFQKYLLNSHPYSLKSQLFDWIKLNSFHLDLFHFTHFSYPVFYSGKFIVTIHDLIKNEFHDKGASTRTWFLYKLKHLGYNFVLKKAIQNSSKIITPTFFVKNELIKNYHLPAEKILSIYEGAESSFLSSPKNNCISKVLQKYGLEEKNYLLYVGNVYPYKNVSALLVLIKKIVNTTEFSKLRLAIVCSRSIFYDRLQTQISEQKLNSTVMLLGFVPDRDLQILYHEALAYITATLAEGFGITGLEAMASGCPVVCSHTSCLPEVYDKAAIYFDPANIDDMIKAVQKIEDNKIRTEMIKLGQIQVQKYSWKKMAQEILGIYKQELKI